MMASLDKSIQLAHKIADISGEIIQQYFRKSYLNSQTKENQVSAIVTIADQEAENAMVDLILKTFPNDGILREEGENVSSKNGRAWVIDPIDGTSAFVKGLPIFGTLIGLVDLENHTPLIGIANQPILQERWLGIKGKTTQFNGKPIINPYSQDSQIPLEDVCLTSTTPLMFITPQQKAIAEKLQQICQRTAFGGDCYNYLSLASGWSAMPMIVLEADLKYYDFCAIVPIVEGTGSKITDWEGNPLNCNSTEVLAASNEDLLQKVLAAIATVKPLKP